MEFRIEVLKPQNLMEFEQRLRKALAIGMQAAVLKSLEVIPPYPPFQSVHPNAKSKRTMRLGKSLSVVRGKHPDAMSYVESPTIGWVGTNVPYAKYVIGDEYGMGQVWYHARRWWTLRGVLDDNAEIIGRVFEAELRKILTE